MAEVPLKPGPAVPFDLFFTTHFLGRTPEELLEMPEEEFYLLIPDKTGEDVEIKAAKAKLREHYTTLAHKAGDMLSENATHLRRVAATFSRRAGVELRVLRRLTRTAPRHVRYILEWLQRLRRMARDAAYRRRIARFLRLFAERVGAPRMADEWLADLEAGVWRRPAVDILTILLRTPGVPPDVLTHAKLAREALRRSQHLRSLAAAAEGLAEVVRAVSSPEEGEARVREALRLKGRELRSLRGVLVWLGRDADLYEAFSGSIMALIDRIASARAALAQDVSRLEERLAFLDRLMERPYDLYQVSYHIYVYHPEPDKKKKTKVGVFEAIFLIDVFVDRETNAFVFTHTVTRRELRRCWEVFCSIWRGFVTYARNRALELGFPPERALLLETWLRALEMEGRVSAGVGSHEELERLPLGAVLLLASKRTYGQRWSLAEASAGTPPKTLTSAELAELHIEEPIRARVLGLAEELMKKPTAELVRELADEFWRLEFYESWERWPETGVKPEGLYIQWKSEGGALGVRSSISEQLSGVLGVPVSEEQLSAAVLKVVFGGEEFTALRIYPLLPDEVAGWEAEAWGMMRDKARGPAGWGHERPA